MDSWGYDVLDHLKETATMIKDMETFLDEVLSAEYVGYDEALVSIDSTSNELPHRCDCDGYFLAKLIAHVNNQKKFTWTLVKSLVPILSMIMWLIRINGNFFKGTHYIID